LLETLLSAHEAAIALDSEGVVVATHHPWPLRGQGLVLGDRFFDGVQAALEDEASDRVGVMELLQGVQRLLQAPHPGFAVPLVAGASTQRRPLLIQGYWVAEAQMAVISGRQLSLMAAGAEDNHRFGEAFADAPDAVLWLVPVREAGEIVDFGIVDASRQADVLCGQPLAGHRVGALQAQLPQLGQVAALRDVFLRGRRRDMSVTVALPARGAGIYFQRVLPVSGGLVVFSRNVSDHVLVQQELADSEQRLRLAAATAMMGIWEAEVGSQRLRWSDEMFVLHGLSAGTPISWERWRGCIHPEDQGLAVGLDALLATRGDFSEQDYRIVRPDGTVRHIRSRAQVLRDLEGAVHRVIGVNIDRTEELGAITRIEGQRQLLDAVLDSLGEGVVALDTAGQVRFANASAREILNDALPVGSRPAVLFGRWQDADCLPLPCSPVSLALEEGEPIDESPVAVLVGAEALWLALRIRPLSDGGGVVVRVRDIRAELQGERERQELQRRLEQTERLRALGTLTGGLAHDMNNMLTVIFTASEALDSGVPPHLSEDVHDIRLAAQQGQHLLSRLLTFSGRVARDRRPTAPASVVGTACRLFRHKLPEHVRLTESLDPGVHTCVVDIDAQEWIQVIHNLLQNACDAIAPGRDGHITVRLAFVPSEPGARTGQVIFEVLDDGQGMTEDQCSRALEPFFTTKAVLRGTGLGLSMVHAIVSGHGGELSLESAVGFGTRVCLRIAGHQRIARRSLPAPAAEPVPPVSGAPLVGQTILLVDDNDGVIRSMSRLLRRRGAVVDAFTDPITALADFTAEPSRYTQALLDVNMPGLSGPELARYLRELRCDLRISLMTGNPAVSSRDGLPVFSKPLRSDVLARLGT